MNKPANLPTEISREEYIKACERQDTELGFICHTEPHSGPWPPPSGAPYSSIMVKKGTDEPFVAHVYLEGRFLFTRGTAWLASGPLPYGDGKPRKIIGVRLEDL